MSFDEHAQAPDDIQEALTAASQHPSRIVVGPAPGRSQSVEPPGEVALAEPMHPSSCPVRGLRWALMRCGWMAEKYPVQTTVAMLAVVGCGWLCSYFGWTMLAALVLYAVYSDD